MDTQQVIQQLKLRNEQVNQETIEQQQRQQHSYNPINEKTEQFIKYSPFLKERSTAAAENHDFNIEITVTSPDDKLGLDTDESYTLAVQVTILETFVTMINQEFTQPISYLSHVRLQGV